MKWFIPILLICIACGKSDSYAPIPRPEAYPRIDLYSEEYSEVAVMDKVLRINSSAEFVTSDKPGWFDIRYPEYGVTVNATLTYATGADLAAALDNRTERMARNLGGASAELTQGGGITLLSAPGALHTPVQLLATDSLTWVLAAVAVTDWPAGTPADSVAPIVSALSADMLRLLDVERR